MSEKKEFEFKIPPSYELNKIAVNLSKHLTANEQAFFVAGFNECIKYLQSNCKHENKYFEPGYMVDDFHCKDCGKEL